MDKPISMSVKDFLIRKLAVELMTSEKLIEAVINHQFQSANEAMSLNNSIEISGFGKFFFNQKKAKKKLKHLIAKRDWMQNALDSGQQSEQRMKTTKNTLDRTISSINSIKPKIDDED